MGCALKFHPPELCRHLEIIGWSRAPATTPGGVLMGPQALLEPSNVELGTYSGGLEYKKTYIMGYLLA